MLSRTLDRARIHVVENGVDHRYYHPSVVVPGKRKDLLVFTGVMNYEPNHNAMMYCLKDIWPQLKKEIPAAKLKIIGRNPLPDLVTLAKSAIDVEVTGEVTDIRKAVSGARVALCTMRLGAGMKNKILESLSMGIPVVTTTEGARGIRFGDGEVGFVADTPHTIVRCIRRLLLDDALWDKVSKKGRLLVERQYSWKSKAEELARVLVR